MSHGQCRNVPGPSLEFRAVGHEYMQPAGHVVLKMWGFTPLGLGDRLNVFRPAPTGLQDEPSDDALTNIYEFKPALLKPPNFIRVT